MAPTRRPTTTAQQENQQDSTMQPLTAEDVSSDIAPPPATEVESTLTNNSSNNNPSNDNAARLERLSSLSIDQIYLSSKQQTRENHWRNNPYAAGLVEPTWRDEVSRNHQDANDDDANGPNRQCCEDVAEPEMDPTCGCLLFTGYICGRLNAGRVGNMVILKESHVMVEEEVQADEEAYDGTTDVGTLRTRKVSKRQIDLIVGPYWPMMMFVTYPIIFTVSLATAINVVFVPNPNPILVIVWSTLTFGLCFSLFSVAFRDPGILPKHKEIPINGKKNTSWRWIDRAQSFAPRGTSKVVFCMLLF